MLVLSRRENEPIYIGDNIVVTVTRILDGTVKIGIEAPKEIAILRHDANVKTPKSAPLECLT